MKRRELLGSLLKPEVPATHPRPPGAVAERDFRRLCDRCDDCIVACPHGAIGHMADGTPAMNPNEAPCHLCEELHCVTVCTTGALVPLPRETLFFGLATVLPDRCFVFRGPECGACKPACPIGALTMVAGRPTISDDKCNGCGLCRDACPVWNKAIQIDW